MATHWRHAGGKLRELGPAGLTEKEFLANLISPEFRAVPPNLLPPKFLIVSGR